MVLAIIGCMVSSQDFRMPVRCSFYVQYADLSQHHYVIPDMNLLRCLAAAHVRDDPVNNSGYVKSGCSASC